MRLWSMLAVVAGCGFDAKLPAGEVPDDGDVVTPEDDKAPDDVMRDPDGYRRRIALDASTTGSALVGFPVLVTLGPDDCNVDFAKIAAMGADLRFYDADGTTLLAHEIERWESGQPRQIWVRVPELVGADHIWMYYGEPSPATVLSPSAVWSASYLAVWHLDASNPVNSVDGVAAAGAGAIATIDDGRVGLALDFDANNNLVDAGDLAGIDLANALTITAWARPRSQGSGRSIVDKRGSSNALSVESASTAARLFGTLQEGNDYNRTTTSNNYAANGVWGHWGAVFSGTDIRLFYDGVERTTDEQSSNAPNGVPDMGNGPLRIGGNAEWDGAIDEVRIADVARAARWIEMEHRSMSGMLATCDAEEPL